MHQQLDFGTLFSKQGANYDQLDNSQWILFQVDTGYPSKVMDGLSELTAMHFNPDSIRFGGLLSPASIDHDCKLLYQLMFEKNKSVILFGASPEWISALQQHFDHYSNPYRLSLISDKTAISNQVNAESLYLKDLHVLGYQRHFHNADLQQGMQAIRLGEIRSSANCIEPFIRMSELVYFDLNAVRFCDCPANYSLNPSGLHAEEAVGISRMIGMGDRVKCMMISDWDEPKDQHSVTAQLVAQMIWYFWEGCHLKHLDKGVDRSQLTHYKVQLHQVDYILHFYKSEQSGKWWFEEPLVDNEFSNQLIPCTYEEYQMAAKDQIPIRILEKING